MLGGWREEIREYVTAAYDSLLTEDSPQAKQPAWIRTALRPHQLSLLEGARRLESHASVSQLSLDAPHLLTRYGVLGDRVGAGKSLVALSLVRDPPVKQTQFSLKEGGSARLIGLQHMPPVQEFRDEWRGISGEELHAEMFGADRRRRFYTRAALFIVPHNVVNQWENYIQEQTDLKAYVVKKTKDCDYTRAGFFADVYTADLVLVSCTMLKKFVGAMSFYNGFTSPFNRIVWSRLFLDEADSLTCTLKAGEVMARFHWFISGSWMNMLFPGGMYSYTLNGLDDATKARLGDGAIAGVRSSQNVVGGHMSHSRDKAFLPLVLRNSEEWINTSLQRPVIVHETVMCKAPANLQVLKEFISPAAMEALHAGDITGAMTALGIKAESKESLGSRVTEKLRLELEQEEKILAFKRTIEYSTPAGKAAAIEKAEAKVARLRGQLASLTERLTTLTDELCPICYDSPRTTTLTPCCRQAFCLACVCECIAKKPACPLCRVAIASAKELLVIGDEAVEGGGAGGGEGAVNDGPQAKGAALLKLLAESTPDQRFLVFSAHEASFKGLREVLRARGIGCEMLQGTGARVDKLRKQFREGKVRVLCMNARHVGAGINLEAATHVVLYHRMNAELERQVIGRAVRFERASELRVVHLVHDQETALNGSHGSEVIMHV